MAKKTKVLFPGYRYHASCPEGKLFESEKDVPAGWVADFADLKPAKTSASKKDEIDL